jgi:hypothetical protein
MLWKCHSFNDEFSELREGLDNGEFGLMTKPMSALELGACLGPNPHQNYQQ